MANETMVTIQGWIGSVPTLRDVGGTPVLNFRVGCTPRHYSRTAGGWVDSPTQWYAVSAWRRLATHGDKSLSHGDPVVIHGRLNHRSYINKSGLEAVSVEIEAITIGHDLTRGVATFLKAPPPSDSGRANPDAAAGFAPPAEDPWAGVHGAPPPDAEPAPETGSPAADTPAGDPPAGQGSASAA